MRGFSKPFVTELFLMYTFQDADGFSVCPNCRYKNCGTVFNARFEWKMALAAWMGRSSKEKLELRGCTSETPGTADHGKSE
jgi:hypothetical protein